MKMLHRSYSLLTFIRRNANLYLSNQVHVLQIGYSKQCTSILITQKFVQVISNTSRSFYSRNGTIGFRRSCFTSSKQAKDEKSKVLKKENDNEKSIEVKHRIIELNEEKLGKLKEQVLSSETVKDQDDGKKKKKTSKAEFQGTAPSTEPKKTIVKKKVRFDPTVSSLERNFITPSRATTDFMLKSADLDTLPKTKRRSPYEFEPPITVYWRKDVEAKALEVWGSREALLKEILKKDLERKMYQQNVFTVKRRLRDYRREVGKRDEAHTQEGLFGRSGIVVMTAVGINAVNFLCKLLTWIYTGSHSMFSECIHSAADTVNQLILAYGIYKSIQTPDVEHPYGYTNMKYVSSLISGVGIFCVGAGLSIYHGIHGLLFPEPIESLYWAYFVLGGSLLSEGATLIVAINSVKKGASEKRKTFREYVMTSQDPSINVVLMEDFAAVIGVACAAGCMGLTSYLGNPMYDAIGSLIVGGLLGGVASFIIYTNVAALVGRSISHDSLDKINAELEADIMVRAIHDVKGIDMGNCLVRYKAEVDFDGRELTRCYLDKNDVSAMWAEVKQMPNVDVFETFLLNLGENIVDSVGGEIDRIELKLKKKHPEIRHCDLEIL